MFINMNNIDTLTRQLRSLGLGHYESQLYLELLKSPRTHLRLAHATGINRTKVYRLIEDLEKRSLVTKRNDDRGTFLVAADPATLEIELVTAEEQLKQQRETLTELMPSLYSLQKGDSHDFVVNTYEGIEGFKQMLWHELKTDGENLIFGNGAIEDLVPDRRWAEKHRTMTLEAGYKLRELINPEQKADVFTDVPHFMDNYEKRSILPEILCMESCIVVYNDTVATYHWRKEQKVGFEVVSASYATMMRSMFEQFWQLAGAKL